MLAEDQETGVVKLGVLVAFVRAAGSIGVSIILIWYFGKNRAGGPKI